MLTITFITNFYPMYVLLGQSTVSYQPVPPVTDPMYKLYNACTLVMNTT